MDGDRFLRAASIWPVRGIAVVRVCAGPAFPVEGAGTQGTNQARFIDIDTPVSLFLATDGAFQL